MPSITVKTGKTYPTDDPSTLGSSIAPLIAAGELEIVIKLTNITGEANVYLLSWDEDCEKWYPIEKLVCNERDEPPLFGHNRFAGIKIPTERNVLLFAPFLEDDEIEACYVAYTPPTLMNLSSPPPIGDVAPNAVTGTTVTATTELVGPLGVNTQNPADVTVVGLLAGSTATPAAGKSYIAPTGSVGAATGISLVQGGGMSVDIKPMGQTATAKSEVVPIAFTLADTETLDYAMGGMGGILIFASSEGSIGGIITVASNGATTEVAITAAVTLTLTTPAKFNIAANAGSARFENLTGGPVDFTGLLVKFGSN